MTTRDQGAAQTPSKEERASPLVAKLARTDKVRVIVGVDASTHAEGYLNANAVAAQRGSISEAQRAVATALSLDDFTLIAQYEFVPFMALEVDAAGLQTLIDSERVTSIEEDVLMRPTLSSTIPIIGADEVHALGFTGSDQTVAILDTGIEGLQPFFGGRVVSEACYSNAGGLGIGASLCPSGEPTQLGAGSAEATTAACLDGETNICAHGSHVAGIAAGNGNSMAGVAKNASILAIQVFTRIDSAADCHPGPAPCVRSYISDQINALERVYALRSAHSIASVNMSLSGGRYTSEVTCDSTFAAQKAVIDLLRSVNIATVIASGNSGFTDGLGSPACISTAISVGATDDDDVVAYFSNSASFLDLLAPGTLVQSSVPGGGFDYFSGTSMAAPHVAGAWALLKEANPDASVSEVEAALENAGVLVTDARNGIVTPRLDIHLASLDIEGTRGKRGGGGGGGGGSLPRPTHLHAQVYVGEGSVVALTWEDNSDNEEGFTLERRQDEGPWSLMETLPPDSEWYRDTTAYPAHPTTTYHYRVQAFNGSDTSSFSNVAGAVMSTEPPVDPVVPYAPTGCISTNAPTFSWSAVPKATLYWVIVSDSWDFSAGGWVVNESNLPHNSLALNFELQPGRQYYWKVKAQNSAGVGPWSGVGTFQPFCSAAEPPVKLSPMGCVTEARPTFSWTEVPGATSYWLQVADSPSFDSESTTPWIDADVTGTSYPSPISFPPTGVFYWRVKTRFGGHGAPWSLTDIFSVNESCAPPPPPPPDTGDVVLLMHCDGDDGSTNFHDETGKRVTVIGDNGGRPIISGNVKRFGDGSCYFNDNGYLSLANSNDWQFGDGDFTVEFYFYRVGEIAAQNGPYEPSSGSASSVIGYLGNADRVESYAWWNGVHSNGSSHRSSWTLRDANNNGGQPSRPPGSEIPLSTWSHYALVREGGTVYAFVDGKLLGTSEFSSSIRVPSTSPILAIGLDHRYASYGWYLKGHVDEIRITKGVGRYTESFAPPEEPFPSPAPPPPPPPDEGAGVVLQMHCDGDDGSTDFIDETGKLVSLVGDNGGHPRISGEAKRFGSGSCYFNDNGYLKLANSEDWHFGEGDFTVEYFFYRFGDVAAYNGPYAPSSGNPSAIIGYTGNVDSVESYAWWNNVYSNGSVHRSSWTFRDPRNNSGSPPSLPGSEIPLGTWSHYALARQGDTIYQFVDGKLLGTSVFDSSIRVPSFGAVLAIGLDHRYASYGWYLKGYVDEIRITKGIGRYTGSFEPPTQPFPPPETP